MCPRLLVPGCGRSRNHPAGEGFIGVQVGRPRLASRGAHGRRWPWAASDGGQRVLGVGSGGSGEQRGPQQLGGELRGRGGCAVEGPGWRWPGASGRSPSRCGGRGAGGSCWRTPRMGRGSGQGVPGGGIGRKGGRCWSPFWVARRTGLPGGTGRPRWRGRQGGSPRRPDRTAPWPGVCRTQAVVTVQRSNARP